MPQFRTLITPVVDAHESPQLPLRVHFVHRRSKHLAAIPLLFCHGWPGSFIEASKIINSLCDPESLHFDINQSAVAFHTVVPSVPGFGFGDPSPKSDFGLKETADLFDALMLRLGYDSYIVHGTGWYVKLWRSDGLLLLSFVRGFKVARLIALRHQTRCVAVHTTSPHIPHCSFRGNLLNYIRYRIAKLSKARISMLSFGYVANDFNYPNPPRNCHHPLGLERQDCQRMQTLSYSLCDSPVGLLAYMIDVIRQSYGSYSWTTTDILNWTMLQWLPGPEAGLKWLKAASQEVSGKSWWRQWVATPLGISYFRPSFGTDFTTPSPPVWASNIFRLTWIRRHEKSARFPAWDVPDDLVLDIRDFVRTLIAQHQLSFSLQQS